jgi:hypothetical protein
MYGSHHQQPQKHGRNDELDPYLVVREPSMHTIHGRPPSWLPCSSRTGHIIASTESYSRVRTCSSSATARELPSVTSKQKPGFPLEPGWQVPTMATPWRSFIRERGRSAASPASWPACALASGRQVFLVSDNFWSARLTVQTTPAMGCGALAHASLSSL